ncbi:MAG: glycosyltransferase family 2 protein [Aeriscardovia sp.]|nr:glycosyltransferase family 2 protein [Aeriscardovia sp.]
MPILTFLDWFLALVGGAMVVYEVFYLVMGLFIKPIVFPPAPQDKRYAILISARNEREVIGQLINSIRKNDYPQDLVDIWLVADNCTDDTAQIATSLGAHVIERHNTVQVGKGFALTYLLNRMEDEKVADKYDAFLVFDADNLLDSHYLTEMNKAFHKGFQILTSYRNSKNLSENWVSAGAALWFIRESRFLNNTRMFLGSSCHVGGTVFLFSREVMKKNGGWKFHLLTEDIEFTLNSIIEGYTIGYCGTAVLYDEQPTSFTQSWRQRVRWSKGFLQVFRYYTIPLLRKMFTDAEFASVDLMLMVCPLTVLWFFREILGVIFICCGIVTWQSQLISLYNWLYGVGWSIAGMMAIAALTAIAERKRIGASNKELLAFVLSFPIYVLSYIPISFQSLFAKSQWKPIVHHKKQGGENE